MFVLARVCILHTGLQEGHGMAGLRRVRRVDATCQSAAARLADPDPLGRLSVVMLGVVVVVVGGGV